MPKPAGAHLSVLDFERELSRLRGGARTMDALRDLVGRLDLTAALAWTRTAPARGRFTRRAIVRRPGFRLLVLSWAPGAMTPIHDHGGAVNVTRVFRGRLTSRLYEIDSATGPHGYLIAPLDEERLGPADLACVEPSELHQLANASRRELVTVHFYTRSLREAKTYTPVSEIRARGGTPVDDFEFDRSIRKKEGVK
jgi:cysteine dioxygenase